MICRTLLILFLLTCCVNPKSSNQTDDTTTLREYATRIVQKSDSVVVEEQCIRGQAGAIVKGNIYPTASFKINDDNLTGTEILKLANGDMLIIRNWGCEYFVLTFRFETQKFNADTTDMKYWLDKAVTLMKEIENGLDAPLDIEGGTLAIIHHINDKKDYNLGDEIVFEDDIIRDFVTLDRVQKIDDSKFAIEISYTTGPL